MTIGKSRAARKTDGFAQKILAWYARHQRRLPWRATGAQRPDPYAVWLSEIMLQQTTVTAVKPYYEAFLTRWPRVEDLAAAPLDEVLKAWAGLGYYSRARNLHAAAQEVAASGGAFPQDEPSLRALPGIGPYTAAAIAAIAFGRKATPVDGNIERVMARYFAVETPLPAAKPELTRLAQSVTPDARAGDFAQGLMDLGAGICAPKTPACALCPLHADCAGRAKGIAASLPRRMPKAARPERSGAVFILRSVRGAVLLQQRPPRGLLGGMMALPATPFETEGARSALAHAPLKARWRKLELQVTHVFTHFRLTLDIYAARAPREDPKLGRWSLHPEDEGLASVMRKAVAAARAAEGRDD